MIGLKMRRKVEGWSLDVSETDSEVGRTTWRQKLAENNKLWIATLLVVVVATGYLIRSQGESKPADLVLPSTHAPADYTDEKHNSFARKFMHDKSLGFTVLRAEFTSPDKFRVLVPGNVGRDDVEFAAKLAGEKILSRFHFRPVVQVYRRSANGQDRYAASARWSPKDFGFIVNHAKIALGAP